MMAAAAPAEAESEAAPTETAAESDDDDDQDEVLEESPCQRWWKRRERVKQRDVPGIDVAYLAMDNDTGNEVVWNEVQFSERKNFKNQEEKIKKIFDNLSELDHTNLVKFHKYWTDTKSDKPRVIFITEYMSSGSMSQFLKRTQKGSKIMSGRAWKKWCTQIISALSYLHSCDPPIVHGNLSCNTIFIQQNGLIKIGCVAPDAIHHHVKTFRENMKNMHYIAPEYEHGAFVTPAADIYSLGVSALEMAVLGFWANGDAAAAPPPVVTKQLMERTILKVADPLQRDFIEQCLRLEPANRPTARELLFHSVLFEVHSLKLLAAHATVNSKMYETMPEDCFRLKDADKDKIIAETKRPDGSAIAHFKYSQVPLIDLDKFLEDVNNGVYPLTAFAPTVRRKDPIVATLAAAPVANAPPPAGPERARSPADPPTGVSPPPVAEAAAPAAADGDVEPPPSAERAVEARKVVRVTAELKELEAGDPTRLLSLMLKLEDAMNRQLTAEIDGGVDSAAALVAELVEHGFIREDDRAAVQAVLTQTLIDAAPS